MLIGYKSSDSKKTNILLKFNTEIINYDKEDGLINIIKKLLSESITEEELTDLEQILNAFPQSLIPHDIPSKYISDIIVKYSKTANLLEEKCLILVIECFSMIENYDPILNELDLFHIIINKITNLSPDLFINCFLMLKVLANIFNSLENKEDSLGSICSLFSQFYDYENYDIFDNLIHFLYNYSIDGNATESGCQLISNSLYSLFEKCDEKFMDLTSFSIERVFWILNALLSKFDSDFEAIFNHQIIQNKNLYLHNSNHEVTTAYITLSGSLFSKGRNPFDLHIFDFIPFLISKNKNMISPSIWIMSIMVDYSQEMADELNFLNLSFFEKIYLDANFNSKYEIACLYQHLINRITISQYFDFFMQNTAMLFNFLELENQEILAAMINFISCLQNSLIKEGNDEKIDAFTNILLSNNFRNYLDDLIEEGILTFSN